MTLLKGFCGENEKYSQLMILFFNGYILADKINN